MVSSKGFICLFLALHPTIIMFVAGYVTQTSTPTPPPPPPAGRILWNVYNWTGINGTVQTPDAAAGTVGLER